MPSVNWNWEREQEIKKRKNGENNKKKTNINKILFCLQNQATKKQNTIRTNNWMAYNLE